MFLKTAIILCEGPKTDAELKAIMATHPWAPTLIHGFRKVRSGTWGDECYLWSSYSLSDSIYVDAGYGYFSTEYWIAEDFHEPQPCLFLQSEDFDKRCELRKAWWKATTDLLLNDIPESYHSYVVHYGELEDEFEPGEAEEAWKQKILANCDYDPKVVAEFESAV